MDGRVFHGILPCEVHLVAGFQPPTGLPIMDGDPSHR